MKERIQVFASSFLLAFVILCMVWACSSRAHASAAAQSTCGIERQAVKTMADPAAAQVLVHSPVESTVTQLRAVKPPPTVPSKLPRQTVEDNVISLHAWLLGYKLEADQDFHVVISEIGKPTLTMIVEIPSPACSPQSYGTQFQQERSWLTHQLPPASKGKMRWFPKPVPVHVVGVFFFDHPHGQTGVAPNAAELHPLLSIEADTVKLSFTQPNVMEQIRSYKITITTSATSAMVSPVKVCPDHWRLEGDVCK